MSSKWIEVPSADAPAAEVARQALAVRMGRIERILPLAAFRYQEDVEHVHQLRTSCRRAAAAIAAFRPLMSNKPKALSKLLRKIRSAAGPARDADVLLARFEAQSTTEEHPDEMIANLRLQRESAQEALVTVAAKYRPRKFKKTVQRTLNSFGNGDRNARQMSYRQFGRSALEAASQAMFQLTSISQPTVAQLHQLRIAGKRLRYSIELFHGVFTPELRSEVYPVVEQLQERLGQLNDHVTAQAMYQKWLFEMPAGELAADLATRIVAEYDSAIEARREFLQWWAAPQTAALESRLIALLHHSA